MGQQRPLNVAFVGCGNIAGAYAGSLKSRPDLVNIVGAFDIQESATSAFGEEWDCPAYDSFEDVLGDEAVDLVVNLTIQQAHYEVSLRSLEAGKHVHSEKPLALTRDEANHLVKTAAERGVRLSCAPFTWMGEAEQTAWKAIRDGRLGQVRVVYAEMNWGRIEWWHPAPANFYAAGVGPLFDVAVYPLAVLTTFFGTVERVRGFGKIVLPQRRTLDGEPFTVEAPDVVIGILEFRSGVVARVTPTFYVRPTTQHGIELHGDEASIHIGSAHDFQAPLMIAPAAGGEWEPLPYVREPYPGVEWGRAIFDVVEALREGRPHRATGAQAAHIVDICNGIIESSERGCPVDVTTTFDPPAPMPWAEPEGPHRVGAPSGP